MPIAISGAKAHKNEKADEKKEPVVKKKTKRTTSSKSAKK